MKYTILVASIASIIFSATAFAATKASSPTTSMKQNILPYFLKKGNYKWDVKSSYGTGKIVGQSTDIFSMVPTFEAKFNSTTTTASVPFYWTSTKSTTATQNTESDSNRIIGRPSIQITRRLKSNSKSTVDYGAGVKLPMASGAQEYTKIMRRWELRPLVKTVTPVSAKADIIANAAISLNGNGTTTLDDNRDISLETATVLNLEGGVAYNYDRKLKVNAIVDLSTSPQKNTVKSGSTVIEKSPYDALGVAFSGDYTLSKDSHISAGFHYAFQQQDSIADALYSFDESEKFAQFSTSVRYTSQF